MKRFMFLACFILCCSQLVALQWSNRSSYEMKWDDAVNYCRNLNEIGHSDWRLPNIDELRTIVKNCSKTQTGGLCKVSERNSCLSYNCAEPKNSCSCEDRKSNNGFFNQLGDDENVKLWSSSVLSDTPALAWYIYFAKAKINNINKVASHYVRCVR